ncbi:M15 family metallopeptidase [Nanoarchaeota archaeon]
MKGLVSLGKYGFIINNSHRKDYTNVKRIFVRKSVVKALIKAKKDLPKGYNFKIWDGKRSIEQQRKIIKLCEKDFKKKHPKNWEKMLIKFTGGYQSLKQKLPKNTHRHGGAVDITIVNNNGKELFMGGITFSEKDALNYYEKKKKLTKKEKKARDNRRLLKKIMKKVGFKPNLNETHHWGYSK